MTSLLQLDLTTAPHATGARATCMRHDEHGAGPAAHPAPPSVADHEAVALERAEAPVRHRIIAGQALLHGKQLEAVAQIVERLVRTPKLVLHGHRRPVCSKCRQPGHNVRTCTGQLFVPGSEP